MTDNNRSPGKYVTFLKKRRRWLISGIVVGAVLGVLLKLPGASEYEAKTRIIFLPTQTNIVFESQIENEVHSQNFLGDFRDEMSDLAYSSDVTNEVLSDVYLLLQPKDRNPDKFLEKVKITESDSGNIITIRVKDKDPDLTLSLANSWAETYVTYINQLLADQSDNLIAQTEEQLVELEETYRIAQRELEVFRLNNSVTLLEHQLHNYNSFLNSQYRLLSDQQTKRHETDLWLENLYTLENQLEMGQLSPDTQADHAAALLVARAHIDRSPINVQLQVQIPQTSTATSQEIAALVPVLEAHQGRLDDSIKTLSSQLQSAPSESTQLSHNEQASYQAHVARQIPDLITRLEAERSKEAELVFARDLAWENYIALQQKLTELRLETQLSDRVLKIAEQAVLETKTRDTIKSFKIAARGAAAGLVIMVIILVIFEYYNQYRSKYIH